MKQLLVRRDPLNLIKKLGKVEKIKEMPEFLAQSPLICDPYFYDKALIRDNRHLPLRKDDNLFEHPSVYEGYKKEGVPAVWSGYRSCVTYDQNIKELFKLKGISFGDKPVVEETEEFVHIRGGQLLNNAQNEKEYSDKFNKILTDHGIKPVMEYIGFYKFPLKLKKGKLVSVGPASGLFRNNILCTSVIKIEGDTRLDELFYVFERLYKDHIQYNGHKEKFECAAGDLCFDLGSKFGALKKLMDVNNQSWSDNPERTNAHMGNVVIYKADENNFGLGLVDFDASCNLKDKSKIDLKIQQEIEYKSIMASIFSGGISYRCVGKDFEPNIAFKEIREAFALGFTKGYKFGLDSTKNTIPFRRIKEVFDLLPEVIIERRRINMDYIDGLENIISKNYMYNKSISTYNNEENYSLDNYTYGKNI